MAASASFTTMATGFNAEGLLDRGRPAQIAVGDFNGDTAGRPRGRELQREQRDDPAAQPAGGALHRRVAEHPGRLRPLGIVAANFDGDGGADLAVAETNADTVTVLLRNAANTGFTQEGAPIAVADGPLGITAADFDGDGRRDLAVASNNAGAVTVLRRQRGRWLRRRPGLPDHPRLRRGGRGLRRRQASRPRGVERRRRPAQLHVLLNPGPPAPPPPRHADPDADPDRAAGRRQGRQHRAGLGQGAAQASRQQPLRRTEGRREDPGRDERGHARRPRHDHRGGRSRQDAGERRLLRRPVQAEPEQGQAGHDAHAHRGAELPAGKKASAAAKPKTRRLWGDGKGKFRTKGSYSAATVRGTRWLDPGPLRLDAHPRRKGVVSVRDDVKRKTVLVRAGRSYTARRKR